MVTATRLVRLLLAVLASLLVLATTTVVVTPGFVGGVRVGADKPHAQVVVLRHDGIGAGQRPGNSPPTYDSASAGEVEEEDPVVLTSRPAPGYTYDSDAPSYDALVRFADARKVARIDVAGPRATAVLYRSQTGAASVGSVSASGFGVAAESLGALEQGAARVPSSWGEGIANGKGVGTRWFDPANKGNGIRIDEGSPGSSFPSQQVDHVVVRNGGSIFGRDGQPISG